MSRKAAMTGRVVALSECLQRVLSVDIIKLINRRVDGNVDDKDDEKDDFSLFLNMVKLLG